MTIDETDPSDPPPDTNDGLEAKGDVGPGRPPKHSRFKSGETGNRRGRPVGAKGRKKIIEQIANEKHSVVEGGERRQRSTLELVLLSLRNLSVEGNRRAFQASHDYLARYGPREPIRSGGYLVVGEVLTEEEWEVEYAKVIENQRRSKDERDTKRG